MVKKSSVKQFIITFICLLFAIFLTYVVHKCFFATKNTEPKSTITSDVMPYYTSGIKEFGELKTVSQKNDRLQISINYPLTDVDILDQEIAKYMQEQNEYASDVYEETDKTKDVELNIQYDSYLNESNDVKQYVSIVFTNTLNSPLISHPQNSIKVFNFDISDNKVLDSSDIIDYSDLNPIIECVKDKIISHPDLSEYAKNVSPSMLDNVVITHTGLNIIFPSGTLFANSAGAQYVHLDYGSINNSLNISKINPFQ